MQNNLAKSGTKGAIIAWVLIFGTVFLIMISGLVSYLVFQIGQNQRMVVESEALNIAEAGINYAKWHLAHNPEDFNFSGTYNYKDPQGSVIGQYQLSITAPSGCDSGTKIESSGWQTGFQNNGRKIKATYVKPSLAKYAFLINSNAWFGPNEELKGPFHSNGGIRMDGSQNALSTSAKETYICGPEHGCSASNCSSPCNWTAQGCECPGIWGDGNGGTDGLWDFPVSNVDFDKITQDLSILRNEATSSGIYLSATNSLGYHLKFKTDGTFDVYKVKKLKSPVWGYNGENWINESNSIDKETFYENFSMPLNCAPIFVEDNIWVEGDINGRVTVVAAKLPDFPGSEAKIVISGNINYANDNSILGLISQKDILIPLYSPDDLEIKAALLAQKGHILRYYYPNWWFEPYKTYAIRNYIETYGSIISNKMWTFTWVDSGGSVVSGYSQTEMSYNPNLTYNPPPYFPVAGDYKITDWREIK